MGMQTSGPIDVYARVSRASDERQRSVQGQVADCLARLEERELPVGEVFVDPSRSAWNPKVKRPGWDTLMGRLEYGPAGGVIVFDLARFSRRPMEGERLIVAAERGLLILDSEGEYDLTTASGKKHFRDQLASAAYESDRLSTRVRRGKRMKAQRGEPTGSWRPFGFEPDGITPRWTEAAVLEEMTQRFLVGESQDAIIADVNRRGIRTSTGKAWTRASFRQVLTRARNAGYVVHRGAIVGRLPGEPIIDPDDHERAVAMYAARKRGRPPSPAYLWSGVALCGLCEHRLAGRPRINKKRYADGEVRREYWCSPSQGGCGRIAIDQRALDAFGRTFTITALSDAQQASDIEAAAKRAAAQADKLDGEIAELEHLTRTLAERLGRGEITLDRYDAATKPLDRRLGEMRAAREALPPSGIAPIDVTASREEWARRWNSRGPADRRSQLRLALRGRRLLVWPANGKRDVAGRITFTVSL